MFLSPAEKMILLAPFLPGEPHKRLQTVLRITERVCVGSMDKDRETLYKTNGGFYMEKKEANNP
jgi:hypothetical protein